MATPSRPYINFKSTAFKDINSTGTIIIDSSAFSQFTGRLDDIFIANQGNGKLTFYLAVIKDGISPVSFLWKIVELNPYESKGIMSGEISYIVPGDIYFAYTDYESNLVTCNVNYIIFNELLPDPI